MPKGWLPSRAFCALRLGGFGIDAGFEAHARMIEAVLFDIDQTLVDFDATDRRALVQAISEAVCGRLASMGYEPPPRRTYERRLLRRFIFAYLYSRLSRREIPLTENLDRLHRRMGMHLDRVETESLYTSCYDALARFVFPDEQSAGVLATLQERGIKLGAVSNTIVPRVALDRYLADVGLLSYLPVRVYSSETRYMKPDRRIFEAALSELGVPPERTLFVGDRIVNDIHGAARLRMQTALIVRSGRVPRSRIKPDHIVQALREVPPIVEAGRA